MVGVRGGSVVSTYHWAQVQAVSLNAYKRASEYKLQLVDGRQIIIKGMYQPTPKGMGSAIEGALANYRTQRQG